MYLTFSDKYRRFTNWNLCYMLYSFVQVHIKVKYIIRKNNLWIQKFDIIFDANNFSWYAKVLFVCGIFLKCLLVKKVL